MTSGTSGRFCIHCFVPLAAEAAACPNCGFPQAEDRYVKALPLGTVLAGRYLIGRILGVGGFGITYLAYDGSDARRRVALKEFFPGDLVNRTTASDGGLQAVAIDPANLQLLAAAADQFARESRLLSQLSHVNIVDVLDTFSLNGTSYMVLRFEDGRTVDRYVRRKERLSEPDAVAITLFVLDGLNALHQAGIVHRDINPRNVYLSDGGRVTVLDLGIAKVLDAARRLTHTLIGSEYFSAPEQFDASGAVPIGPEADVYACGATLFFMLTGRNPPQRVIGAPEESLPWSASVSVSPRVRAAIEKAMSPNPRNRFATADAFRRELLETRHAASVKAVVARSRFVGAAVAGFAILVIGGLSYAFLPGSDDRRDANAVQPPSQPVAAAPVIDNRPAAPTTPPDLGAIESAPPVSLPAARAPGGTKSPRGKKRRGGADIDDDERRAWNLK